ncbi:MULTISPECIES: zeta toxin family protein [Marinomonas]|uniref:Zeta toxin family protein n=1 Tax=Marinomonas arctica TaxID=383750 RepID=A0A7H1JA15_9GAMM|nr:MULTISPECIES: zeta toxin family protein [Marinomonas]QNT07331.1 zeta toxin family protein [Marinomonas arctica]GGN27390.1 ATPase AAA [Marinomonas arctica]
MASLRLIAGPNGSGKTTLTKLLREEYAVPLGQYLNPDDIAKHISFSSIDDTLPDNTFLAAKLAQFISVGLRDDWVKDGLSFTYESVMSHESHIQFVEGAKKIGYKSYLYYVCTSEVELNKARVEQRVKEGGHTVPEDKIASRYQRSLENLHEMLTICRRGFLFDNSSTEMTFIAEVTQDGYLDIKAKAFNETQPYWFVEHVVKKWIKEKVRLIR